MKEKIDKYYEEKQNELESQNLKSKKDSRIVNKSLEHREELKFIQSLDKSRSGRNVVPKIINSSPKSDRFTYIDKNYMLNSFKNESKPKIESKETEENLLIYDTSIFFLFSSFFFFSSSFFLFLLFLYNFDKYKLSSLFISFIFIT